MKKEKENNQEKKQGAVYQAKERTLIPGTDLSAEDEQDILREAAPAYGVQGTETDGSEEFAEWNGKKQGEYTIEDYYQLPEDVRAELIDGVIFVMEAPATIHQAISAEIHFAFKSYIKRKKGTCKTYYSLLDIQLNRDNKTMVQPDVVIMCNRDIIQRKVIYGAPDLVVEVLSKSTRMKDRNIKLRKYREAGVREYWMVDPEQRQVIVYLFEEQQIYSQMIYDFGEQVPVGIFDGECQVDFEEIYEEVRYLYEKE